MFPEVTKSLNEPMRRKDADDGLSGELGEMIPAGPPDQDQWLEREAVRQRMAELYEKLTDFEKEVVRLRVMEDWTLDRIGKKFGRSRERIRQIMMDIQLVAQKKPRYYSKGGWWIGRSRVRGPGKGIYGKKSDGHLDSGPDRPWPDSPDRGLDWLTAGRGSGDGEGEEGVG